MAAPSLSLYAGDTLTVSLTVLRADGVTPVDLTGATVKFGVGAYGSPLFTKSVGSDIVVTNAPQGLATVTISPADTAGIPAGTYFFDVIVVEASGPRSTVASGTVVISDHVVKT